MKELEKLFWISYYLKGYKLYEENVELLNSNQDNNRRASLLKSKAKNNEELKEIDEVLLELKVKYDLIEESKDALLNIFDFSPVMYKKQYYEYKKLLKLFVITSTYDWMQRKTFRSDREKFISIKEFLRGFYGTYSQKLYKIYNDNELFKEAFKEILKKERLPQTLNKV